VRRFAKGLVLFGLEVFTSMAKRGVLPGKFACPPGKLPETPD
jgi:hypothetical protein